MQFSVFLTTRSMAPEEDEAILDATIQHASRAEELGFDAVFSPDHHFTGYAPWASDPFIFMAYLAATLKRVYFGFSVTTLPLHHPVRFAERLNLLDQLTKGRMLVGIGSGTTPEESVGFGIKFQDASRVSLENQEIIFKLWGKKIEDEPVLFDTGSYKGAVVQRIVPAPYTQPHPRVMPVAARPSSVALAATNGWPAFIHSFSIPPRGGEDPLATWAANFNVYHQALLAAGHSDQVVADALSWTTRTYQCVHVAPTDEQARAELETILTAYQSAIDREYTFNKRAEEISGVNLPPQTNALTEDFINTWCLYGSPDTVAAQVQQYADAGAGNILCSLTNGLLTPERWRLANQSMELFATQVMPRFKTAAQG